MNHLKLSEISFLNLTLTLCMIWFKITFDGKNPRLLELQREDCLSQVSPGNLKFLTEFMFDKFDATCVCYCKC